MIYQFDKSKENQPYQNEHDELFDAIAKGEYKFWDAERGAKSTMTSILGRMATYSGEIIEWDKAINSGINIMPSTYSFDAMPPVNPKQMECMHVQCLVKQNIFDIGGNGDSYLEQYTVYKVIQLVCAGLSAAAMRKAYNLFR